jgi:hypothetical protein
MAVNVVAMKPNGSPSRSEKRTPQCILVDYIMLAKICSLV